MNNTIRLALIVCFSLLSLYACTAAAEPSYGDFGKYHALVIGINRYTNHPNLKTATNDAKTVASLLKNDFGFRVKRLDNPSRNEILDSLNHYRQTLGNNDNLLIYYAGHGVVDRGSGNGFWLPSEANQNSDTNWVALNRVTSTIKAMNAKHVMIVADSCYSGKLTRGTHVKQKAPNYYAKMARTKTRVVMTAGGLEPVLDSGGGNHSVFANAFIRTLRESPSVIDGTDLFSKVRRRVMLDANQTPEYGDIRLAGHDGGDFIFTKIAKDSSAKKLVRDQQRQPQAFEKQVLKLPMQGYLKANVIQKKKISKCCLRWSLCVS
jgi:uncharacterized caspase-like protein